MPSPVFLEKSAQALGAPVEYAGSTRTDALYREPRYRDKPDPPRKPSAPVAHTRETANDYITKMIYVQVQSLLTVGMGRDMVTPLEGPG